MEKDRPKRRKINRKKVMIRLCLVVSVFFVSYFILVNTLVSAALVPSFMEKLEAFERITEESYAAQVQTSDIKNNRTAFQIETREWLETAEIQKLSRKTKDGYTLIAAEFPAGSQEKQKEEVLTEKKKDNPEESHNWVLLLHGYTGWKEEMYPFAHWYYERGFHVVVPDLRCQGESEGDFIGMGWTDHFDGKLWLDYILSQDDNAKIVIHGQSMGAAAALIMAGDNLAEQVKMVVSDCAYTDAYSMFGEKVKEWFHLPAFPIVDTACLLLKLRGGYNLKDASAIDAVKKSSVPILLIHGDQDVMISVQMARELYDAANCEKELLIVEGAGHAQSQDKDPEAYYGAIDTYIDRYMD